MIKEPNKTVELAFELIEQLTTWIQVVEKRIAKLEKRIFRLEKHR